VAQSSWVGGGCVERGGGNEGLESTDSCYRWQFMRLRASETSRSAAFTALYTGLRTISNVATLEQNSGEAGPLRRICAFGSELRGYDTQDYLAGLAVLTPLRLLLQEK
jgi:hypothetical protein